MTQNLFKSKPMKETSLLSSRPPRFAVQLSLLNREANTKIPAYLKNLSFKGGFLETIPMTHKKTMDLEFAFPGHKGHFHITARVIWCRQVNETSKNKPPGMGFEFLSFKKGTEEELSNQLRYWGEIQDKGSFPKVNLHALLKSQNSQLKRKFPASQTKSPFIFSNIREKEIDEALNFIKTDSN